MKTKKQKKRKTKRKGGVRYFDYDIETYSTLFNVSSQVKDSDIQEAFEAVTKSTVASIVKNGDIKQVTISTTNNLEFIEFLDSFRLYLGKYPILKMVRTARRWVLDDELDDDLVQDLTPDVPGTFYVQLALEPFQLPEPEPLPEPAKYIATDLTLPESAAATKIGNFMNFTRTRRRARFRARYLKKVCSDSGVCIAFGLELKRLLDFFNFKTFLFVSKITPIARGVNGFVQLLEYTREGYTSHAVLKSPFSHDSDSLSIEHCVGQYINKKNAFFPCLVTTYGLYRYATPESKVLSEQGRTSKISLTDCSGICLTPIKEVAEMCDSDQLCILTEAFKDAKPLSSKLVKLDTTVTLDNDFLQTDVLSTLYLIYYTLSKLPEFTHFDLHTGNVLLYEPVRGSCIEYNIRIEGIQVQFKSRYLPKIIDYGESVCPENDQLQKDMVKSCGVPRGFIPNGFSHLHVQPDETIDLRLLKILYNYIPKNTTPLLLFLEKVMAGNVDVVDAEMGLRALVLQNQTKNYRYYRTFKRLGVLNIDGEQPMEFVSTP